MIVVKGNKQIISLDFFTEIVTPTAEACVNIIFTGQVQILSDIGVLCITTTEREAKPRTITLLKTKRIWRLEYQVIVDYVFANRI